MRTSKLASWVVGGFVAAGFIGCNQGDSVIDPAAIPPGVPAEEVPATVPPTTKPPRKLPAPGTGVSLPWSRQVIGEMPLNWDIRDGAQMVQLASGRILMIGGWSLYAPWGPNYIPGEGGGDRITNEVWKSDDLGGTWSMLLAHDPTPPTTGPGARFPPGHAIGVVSHNGHAVVMGNDSSVEVVQVGDVWSESNNGATWTRISTEAPVISPLLFMCGTYKDDIYVMGGQWSLETGDTGNNEVWRSSDGGVTWRRLPNALWSPRGAVFRPTEHHGKMFVIGGGLYADTPYQPSSYNGVYAFDGTTWTTVLPDGHKQFEAGYYNSVVSLAGRLWIFNGYNSDREANLGRAVFSEDDGLTWQSFEGGSGGVPSHADATVVASGRILRISGNMDSDERWVWEFKP